MGCWGLVDIDCRSLIDKGIKEFRYLLVLARFDISLPLREDVSNSLDNRWLLSSIIYFALFRTAAVYNSLKNGESVLIIFAALLIALSILAIWYFAMLPP